MFILAFIHKHIYIKFISVAVEIYISIFDIVFYNLLVLFNNVLLTSFVVSTCRSSSCRERFCCMDIS